jgi:hypothetical protein
MLRPLTTIVALTAALVSTPTALALHAPRDSGAQRASVAPNVYGSDQLGPGYVRLASPGARPSPCFGSRACPSSVSAPTRNVRAVQPSRTTSQCPCNAGLPAGTTSTGLTATVGPYLRSGQLLTRGERVTLRLAGDANRVSPAASVSATSSHGFNWTSAGIGAAVGAALILLALAGTTLLRHRRSEPRPA